MRRPVGYVKANTLELARAVTGGFAPGPGIRAESVASGDPDAQVQWAWNRFSVLWLCCDYCRVLVLPEFIVSVPRNEKLRWAPEVGLSVFK